MSATEAVIEQIKKLPFEEKKKVAVFLVEDITKDDPKRWLGKKLTFEEACNVVFRENRELLSLLAK